MTLSALLRSTHHLSSIAYQPSSTASGVGSSRIPLPALTGHPAAHIAIARVVGRHADHIALPAVLECIAERISAQGLGRGLERGGRVPPNPEGGGGGNPLQ